MVEENPVPGAGFVQRMRSAFGGRAALPFDAKALEAVNSQLDSMKGHLRAIREELGKIKDAPNLGKVMGLGGGSGGSGSYIKATTPLTAGGTGTAAGAGGQPAQPTAQSPVAGGMTQTRLASFANQMIPPASTNYSSGGSYVNAAGQYAMRQAGSAAMQQLASGAGARAAASAGVSALGQAGPFAAGSAGAIAAQSVANMSANLFAPLNERIDRGYAYSLSADKMSVLYQQMTGMSQLGVSSAYRQPLTNYRLGATGINDLMAMQSTTGLSALGQARSVEAIQTGSGYSLSSADAVNMINNLADPAVNNQMYMMTGISLYGPGGVENSAQSVIQQLSRFVNVTSERSGRAALGAGSFTRARLASMGLSDEMQTQVIQYAMQNYQFKQKGGEGYYDPANEEHRRRMGIEENFATQQQETTRLGVSREEDFYRRQVDNFADLERMTQTLTKAFGALEEQLSGVIGAKISTRPVGKVAGSAMRTGGTALTALGAAAMFVNPLAGGAMVIGGLGLSGLSGLIGDGPQEVRDSRPSPGGRQYASTRSANMSAIDPNTKIYGGTVGQLLSRWDFKGLHPTMQQRVLNVILQSNGRVGFGNGLRSTQQQADMFFDRYRKTNRTDRNQRVNSSDKWYQGAWWEKVKGAEANPPGQSLHEFGLAVDFSGDFNLAMQLAKKNGLVTFENVNNEPWHAQPVEIPKGFQEWDQAGRPWANGKGGGSVGSSIAEAGQGSDPSDPNSDPESYAPSARSVFTFANGTSLADMILGGGGGGASLGVLTDADSPVTGGGTISSSSGVGVGGGTSTNIAAGVLTAEQLVSVFKAHGFTGTDLQKGVAISWRESRWNSRAHNPNPPDDSYGLMQINMIGNLGPSRREWFGISSNEELFDPNTNIRAARLILDSGGWKHWKPGDGPNETYGTDMAWAAQVVRAVESGKTAPAGPSVNPTGDGPVSTQSMVSASSMGRISRPEYVGHGPESAQATASATMTPRVTSRTSNYNVTISPTIHINGSSQRDVERMAKEIGSLLEREVKYTLMRES